MRPKTMKKRPRSEFFVNVTNLDFRNTLHGFGWILKIPASKKVIKNRTSTVSGKEFQKNTHTFSRKSTKLVIFGRPLAVLWAHAQVYLLLGAPCRSQVVPASPEIKANKAAKASKVGKTSCIGTTFAHKLLHKFCNYSAVAFA